MWILKPATTEGGASLVLLPHRSLEAVDSNMIGASELPVAEYHPAVKDFSSTL